MTTEDMSAPRGKIFRSVGSALGSLVQRRREAKRARLDAGLARIGDRLGLHSTTTAPGTQRAEAAFNVHQTGDMVRNIYYAPDMDGHAEPGEVVWIRIAPEEGAEPEDRAILVVGHGMETILGLLISPNTCHANKSGWVDIGSGSWDTSGEPCWLRLDKVIEVPELAIRREGAIVPKRRFERIANKLRSDYNWG